MEKLPANVSDAEFNRVLDDIRAQHPRRIWDLSFKDKNLEAAFMKYYAARTLDKNIFFALIAAVALAVFSVLLWITTAPAVWKWTTPVLLAGATLALIVHVILKHALPLCSQLVPYQYHITGFGALLTLLNLLMGLEGSYIPYSVSGYDDAIFDAKIRHHFVMTLYMGTASLGIGLHWACVIAVLSVLGNYLVLTIGLGAHVTTYAATIAAYAFASFTALTEAYVLQKKMRDVFLMERIVSDVQAAKPGAIELGSTADLVENIRRARMRRAGADVKLSQ
ncbi:hypothetical protein HDU86_008311 [Geranomyces michiganensis]|nr:hypothetical protein HDU86_008311 [Geranomyces michiganensis]